MARGRATPGTDPTPHLGPGYMDRLPDDGPLPDLSLYEHLISDGLTAADARQGPVDHVTARRLAIWLAAHPQIPPFGQNLVRFTETGAISTDLKNQLRFYSRSGSYPYHHQVDRLHEYVRARGNQLGPIGDHFGTACDQLDRADLMLTDIYKHAGQGEAWPDTDGPGLTALARYHPDTRTVTLILDATTASTAIYAIAAHADDREAHTREIQLRSQALPEDSYGHRNRQAIAARETRITTRLRAIEQAYQSAIEHGSTPKPIGALSPPECAVGEAIDREAEP